MRLEIFTLAAASALPLASALSLGGIVDGLRDRLSLTFGPQLPHRDHGAMLRPELPDSGGRKDGAPTLGDIIGIEKRCSIMSDYALGVDEIARRLHDPEMGTLIFAPINSAIVALPQKPWLGTTDGKVHEEARHDDDSASRNIAKFVGDHLVSHWPPHGSCTVKTFSGQQLKLIAHGQDDWTVETEAGGKYTVLARKTATNGAIWVLDGVLVRATSPNTNSEADDVRRKDFL
ncbi:hypothetical protein PYCC9005_000349 [Savitreella phatthalungensis]